MSEPIRCFGAAPGLMQDYHDREWGVPLTDERGLFELLILEGAQAGLSWATILQRREGYRRAFEGFDAAKVAAYGPEDVQRLLGDAAIIRNRLKIEAAILNARAALKLREEEGGLAVFLWRFADGKPLSPRYSSLKDVPAQTPLSEKISSELKRKGFKFVGPTIIYAYMQSMGLTNDHAVSCFRHSEVERLSATFL